MTTGKDLRPSQEVELEKLIDECGLSAVLQSLHNICQEKADHIRISYGDNHLARQWCGAAGEIGMTVTKGYINAVGRP